MFKEIREIDNHSHKKELENYDNIISEIQCSNLSHGNTFLILSQNNIKNYKNNIEVDKYEIINNWLVLSRSKLRIKNPDIKNTSNLSYLSSEYDALIEGAYLLKVGDIFKMGKIIFKVIEIFILKNKSLNDNCSNYIDDSNANLNIFESRHIIKTENNDSISKGNNELLQLQIGKNKRNSYLNSNLTIENNNNNKIKNLDYYKDNYINNKSIETKNNNQNFSTKDLVKIQNNKSNVNKEDIICRVCLIDSIDNNDPLICPCNCTGSVKFVHLSCLKNWIKSKQNVKYYKNLTVISFKLINCEICKSRIPTEVKIKNKTVRLLTVEKPNDSNYIILEGFFWDEKKTKNWYILHLSNEENTINFGRANNSDVRMSCISVSRDHAYIKLFKEKFYLVDLNSKFGTLVLITNNIQLIPYKKISIQYNNACITFLVKHKRSFLYRICNLISIKNFVIDTLNKKKKKPLKKIMHKNYSDYFDNTPASLISDKFKVKNIESHFNYMNVLNKKSSSKFSEKNLLKEESHKLKSLNLINILNYTKCNNLEKKSNIKIGCKNDSNLIEELKNNSESIKSSNNNKTKEQEVIDYFNIMNEDSAYGNEIIETNRLNNYKNDAKSNILNIDNNFDNQNDALQDNINNNNNTIDNKVFELRKITRDKTTDLNLVHIKELVNTNLLLKNKENKLLEHNNLEKDLENKKQLRIKNLEENLNIKLTSSKLDENTNEINEYVNNILQKPNLENNKIL